MKFLVVAQDRAELEKLTSTISEAEPEAEVVSARNFGEAQTIMRGNECDVVFIDVDHESKITAADLATEIKSRSQNAHIIFVSKSEKHMPDAFRVHADAYLLKPVKPEDIQRETDYMINHYPAPLRLLELYVQTFGGFNVYVRGKKLHFKRNKARELLAILVDNRGIGLNTKEVCAMLFDGRKYNEILLGYYHVVLTSLKSTLEEAGVKNLIRKSVNYIAINPEVVDCDMYRYLRGEPEAINNYHGDYMSCYSWTEYSPKKVEEIRKDAKEAKKNKRVKGNS